MKKSITIILIVVAFIVGGAGGYFVSGFTKFTPDTIYLTQVQLELTNAENQRFFNDEPALINWIDTNKDQLLQYDGDADGIKIQELAAKNGYFIPFNYEKWTGANGLKRR